MSRHAGRYWPLTDAEIERHLRAIAADLWWPTQPQDERTDREYRIQPPAAKN